VTFINTGNPIEKTYSIPKTHWIREYGLDVTEIAKLKVMEEHGKVEIVNTEKVKEGPFQDEVKVSFNDLPDEGASRLTNGYYDLMEVVLREKYPVDTKTLHSIIKASFDLPGYPEYPKIEDIKILATKMYGKTDGNLSETPQQLKSYLVSYYVVPPTTS
jgi:hypothetical protein